MSTDVASEETRRYGRSAGLLTLALGLGGLLAYAFFAVSSHTLDRDDYGTIVVLWSVNFVVAATLVPADRAAARRGRSPSTTTPASPAGTCCESRP